MKNRNKKEEKKKQSTGVQNFNYLNTRETLQEQAKRISGPTYETLNRLILPLAHHVVISNRRARQLVRGLHACGFTLKQHAGDKFEVVRL